MQPDKPAMRPGKSGVRMLLVLLAITILAICVTAIIIVLASRPDPAAVERQFTIYVQSIGKAGKLVLVESRERLTIRETTIARLFGDSAIGRLLNIRSDATIEISAWADIALAIDLLDPAWSIRYSPRDKGYAILALPPLGMLTPAILTDTVEIRTMGRSFLLDEQTLHENALRGLTARFIETAASIRDDPVVRAMAIEAIEDIVLQFAAKFRIPLVRVDVAFATADVP
jgi:type II secretory pathway pseudopilin PulG